MTTSASHKMAAVPQSIDTVKLTTSFIKCLRNCLSGKDIKASAFSAVQAEFERAKGDVDSKRIFLDQSFRDCVTSDCKLDMEKCSDLVQLSIKGVRVKMCSDNLPIILLSDMFDIISLQDCEKLFFCVEENIDVWKETAFFQAVKNHILRICNDLLRRLSRTQNTVFCGRILLFLAKFFPFSERSGLNIISEFNLDNTTVFSSQVGDNFTGKEDGEISTKNDKMDVTDEPDSKKIRIEEDERDLNIDYALYSKFWQLQDFFRNPIQCYEKSKWLLFSKHAKDVFAIFKSFKLDSISGKKKYQRGPTSDIETTLEHSKKNGTSVSSYENHTKQEQQSQDYFAKYLTNQNLLQLQLSDSNFRRYILVQFLILFQYLKSAVKFKNDSQVLTDDQSRWVSDVTEQAYVLIDETPPNGPEFAKAVKHILKREEQWNAWKNDGCPALGKEISKPSESVLSEEGAKENSVTSKGIGCNLSRKRKRKVGEQIEEALKNKRYLMGNATLTKLWNVCPDNFEAAAAPERDFLPNMEDYFAEATEQLDPANQVEDTYKKVNDGQWGWRALRLLAKKSPHFFTYGNNPIGKLNEYLETMLRKMSPALQQSLLSQTTDAVSPIGTQCKSGNVLLDKDSAIPFVSDKINTIEFGIDNHKYSGIKEQTFEEVTNEQETQCVVSSGIEVFRKDTIDEADVLLKSALMADQENQQNRTESIASFRCKSIRVGSYRCNMESYKKDVVRFEEGGFMVKLPPMDANYLVKIKISRKNILHVKAYFSTSSPLFFLHLTQQASSSIRYELEELVQKDDPDKIRPYFDSSSKEESMKYLTLCPDEMTLEAKNLFSKHYGNILEELNKKTAYDMLLKTSPKQFPFSSKFPPVFNSISLRVNNTLKYCQYPPSGSNCISVTAEDYCCLEKGVFLNDSIIDFFLKWLQFSKLKDKDRDRTHIFSTFFYKRLTTTDRNKSIDKTEGKNLSSAAKRYERIKRWTKNVNIFEKDFVIVPINQHSHWFVVVICFPGCDPGCYDFETGKPVKEPIIQKNAKSEQMKMRNQSAKIDPVKTINLIDDMSSDYDEADALDSDILEMIEPDKKRLSEKLYKNAMPSLWQTQISNSADFSNVMLSHEKLHRSPSDKSEYNTIADNRIHGLRESCSYSPSSPSEVDESDNFNLAMEDDDIIKQTENSDYELGISPTYSSQSNCSDDDTKVKKPSSPDTNCQKIKQPCLLIFDSLQTKSRAKVASTIRDYLTYEYSSKVSGETREFTVENFPACCPKVPQQNNSSDCGIYVLQYIESFFDNPLNNYELPNFEILESPEQWFLTTSVVQKRATIAKLIRQLTAEQTPRKEFAFPKLVFNSSRKNKKLKEAEKQVKKYDKSVERTTNGSLAGTDQHKACSSSEILPLHLSNYHRLSGDDMGTS